MTGSLQIKNGKYYMVINLYKDGKRYPKWKSTGLPIKGNKKRAEMMLRDYLKQAETGEITVKTEGSGTLFADAVKRWLIKKASEVDEVTMQGYRVLAESQIIPYFAERKYTLLDLDRKKLQEYFDAKAQSGKVHGEGGLSPASLRLHKNIIMQVLTEAVEEGTLHTNPCTQIKLPHKEHYEGKFISAEDLSKLLADIRDEPTYPLFAVIAVYGLRRSEALGLQWDAVDFANDMIIIRRAVTKVTEVVEKERTKNKSSRRALPLTPEVRELLLQVKAQQEDDRRICGSSYAENNYVFKWPNGEPFRPDYVTRRFSQLLKKHGYEHFRVHDLRHSAASNMLAKGFNLKDVSEWLGHADIDTTADIYGHIDMARKKNLAAEQGNLLSTEC